VLRASHATTYFARRATPFMIATNVKNGVPLRRDRWKRVSKKRRHSLPLNGKKKNSHRRKRWTHPNLQLHRLLLRSSEKKKRGKRILVEEAPLCMICELNGVNTPLEGESLVNCVTSWGNEFTGCPLLMCNDCWETHFHDCDGVTHIIHEGQSSMKGDATKVFVAGKIFEKDVSPARWKQIQQQYARPVEAPPVETTPTLDQKHVQSGTIDLTDDSQPKPKTSSKPRPTEKDKEEKRKEFEAREAKQNELLYSNQKIEKVKSISDQFIVTMNKAVCNGEEEKKQKQKQVLALAASGNTPICSRIDLETLSIELWDSPNASVRPLLVRQPLKSANSTSQKDHQIGEAYAILFRDGSMRRSLVPLNDVIALFL